MHRIPSLPTNSVSANRHDITLLSEHIHRCEILRKSILRYKLPHFAIFRSVLLSLMIYKILNGRIAKTISAKTKDCRKKRSNIGGYASDLHSVLGATVRVIV
jgi:hypothetical protein